MGNALRNRCIAVVIGVAASTGGAFSLTPASASLHAQVVDPYTGGTVAPAGAPCPPGSLTVTPERVAVGDELTLSTRGQRPNSVATFDVAGTALRSIRTDASGQASVITRAPTESAAVFEVAVEGACGIATASVTPRAASVLGAEFGRGFARTGFHLLPWLLAAIGAISLGWQLLRESGENRRHRRAATRHKPTRVPPVARPAPRANTTRR